ncbi:unnamed protein product [Calicophoron daubneyi]|uniref:Uncharacterized protein n=1 Tax=Calicophoron daubneyi TaxID=300641 RepID=A0AAV2TBY6_CALDB
MREGENGDSDDTDRETEEESGGSGDAEEEETCNERMKKLEDDINRISELQQLMGTALEGVKQKTDKIEAIKQVLLSKGWPAVRPIFLRPKYRRMVRSIRKGGIKNAELLKELMAMVNYFMDEAETGENVDRPAGTVGEMASASGVASKDEKIQCGEDSLDLRDLMEGLDTKSVSKFIEELSELSDLSFDEVIEKIYE